MSLGFDLYNSLPSETKTLENCLIWLSGIGKAIPNYSCEREGKSVAVITGITWSLSAQMGTLLELYKFPQLHSILKNVHFNNSAGEQIFLDDKRISEATYDILNYVSFPHGTGLQVKVGEFVPQAPHGHSLSINEEVIEWAISFKEAPHSVCSNSCNPGFWKTPLEGKAVCCFDCTPCPGNEISNETGMERSFYL
ncbi:vomeronasal type-2 receptor 116-like isoform X2 [Tamandua tetradactyla]|uniref:vomeronasal type-2 receptor 116-like isoform X2 n=1 Tax=Tamandua tetradactyla TaxID=48850 RepID=UPI0040546BD4